jgi:hypothetical protein
MRFRHAVAAWFGVVLFLAVPAGARADLIFDVTTADRVVQAPATETFLGSITNQTLQDLNATDIFVLFSGFDPAVVTAEQLLGDPDFGIPVGSTASGIALFRISLAASALPDTTYFVDVQLQDVNDNFSDILTVSLRNSTADGAAPQPGSLALLFTGLLPLIAVRRRRANFRASR